MKNNKVDPRAQPPEDSQGHAYQHELGDPRKAQQIEHHLEEADKSAGRKEGPSSTIDSRPLVLITGSTGLIGTALTNRLAARYRVVGLDLKKPAKAPVGTDFVTCDLTKDRSVSAALRTIRARHGQEIASVIHLAAYYDFSGEPSPMYEELTVQGTRRLLRGLSSFLVEQFVFSSTILVMAPSEAEREPIRESSPLEEEPWDYPRSKIQAESVIQSERGEIPVVILRIAGVYDEYGHAVPIAQQINRIHQKELESYFFPGDADHGQPFIHLDDLVSCVQQVIGRRADLDPVEIFLIAEEDLMSYRDLQNEIGILIHGEEWTTVWIPKLMAKAGAWAKSKIAGDTQGFIKPWMIDLADDHYPVSIQRANRKLHWEPKHRLRDTLPKIIEHLRNDPKKWFAINKLQAPKDAKKSA
jgi:nucleoside-diphosphate-sugar epimerase